MLATDPDCDRVGIAVRHGGEYKLMTGNEVGCMLTEYILSRRKAQGTLCDNPVVVKTIVTTELIRAIAKEYNAEVFDLLTGFKYIGELIEQLKEKGANRVFCFSTFGQFTEGFDKFDQAAKEGVFDRIFTTNLIYRRPELADKEWYTEVNMCKYVAYLIDTLNNDATISTLLNPV